MSFHEQLFAPLPGSSEISFRTCRSPGILKSGTISNLGSVDEIIGKFGGADKLRDAGSDLQALLYNNQNSGLNYGQ
jgi:hypothetical protein